MEHGAWSRESRAEDTEHGHPLFAWQRGERGVNQ